MLESTHRLIGKLCRPAEVDDLFDARAQCQHGHRATCRSGSRSRWPCIRDESRRRVRQRERPLARSPKACPGVPRRASNVLCGAVAANRDGLAATHAESTSRSRRSGRPALLQARGGVKRKPFRPPAGGDSGEALGVVKLDDGSSASSVAGRSTHTTSASRQRSRTCTHAPIAVSAPRDDARRPSTTRHRATGMPGRDDESIGFSPTGSRCRMRSAG